MARYLVRSCSAYILNHDCIMCRDPLVNDSPSRFWKNHSHFRTRLNQPSIRMSGQNDGTDGMATLCFANRAICCE